MRFALSDTSLQMSSFSGSVLVEDTFREHEPIGESTKMIDSVYNISQFSPAFESSRIPDQIQQVNETIYYDALSQPIYDQTFFDPNLYNNYEYSSINNTISDPCQGPKGNFHIPIQVPIPHPYLSNMGNHLYPLSQGDQWQNAGRDMFCQTPMAARCDLAYQTPPNPNLHTNSHTPDGGNPCDIYYNDSIDSSGYGSECMSTPENQTNDPATEDFQDDSIAYKLDWSELLKEDPAQHKEESSKELDEIMSLLKQYNEDPDLPACQPIAPSIPRRKPKKRACSSPEIHGPRPKRARRVCREPRRYNSPTVSVLTTWLKSNIKNPYPTISEKKELMRKTGLDRGQIRQWFVNARRRYAREGRRPVRTTR
ncbi:hypothetical protein ACHWQZ_G003427 [Mnemiopsis leidyi]